MLFFLLQFLFSKHYSIPCAKIITRPGSTSTSSLMCALSQLSTRTACFPAITRNKTLLSTQVGRFAYYVQIQYAISNIISIAVAFESTVIFTWNPPTNVAVIDPPIVLSRLQRAQSPWPSSLVAVLHQVVQDVRRTTRLGQRPLDHHLQWPIQQHNSNMASIL